MRKSSDLLNKPVVSMDNGTLLGAVKDVYFDPNLEVISGLHLGSEGLIKRKYLFIEASEIVLLGQDVILVRRADAVQDSETNVAYRDWQRREVLLGRSIETSGGTVVAALGDIILGSQGEVSAVALTKAQIDSPVAEAGYIKRDAVIKAGGEEPVIVVDLAKAEQQSSEALD